MITEAKPRVFLYTVAYDYGFAPNPFHGVCTLATCKPDIRKAAQIGDYIAGKGPTPWNNNLVYAMIVDEVLAYDSYWNDERFQVKKPVMNASIMMAYGDNIYHRPRPEADYVQSHSHHSHRDGTTNEKNVHHDTKRTDRVLIGRRFSYFGKGGPALPSLETDITKPIRNMRCNFCSADYQTLLIYLDRLLGRGYTGEPAGW